MQKFDFVKNLELIVNEIHSIEILNHFNQATKQSNKTYQFGDLNPILFLSKSNYDKLKSNEECFEIMRRMDSEYLYSESNLSRLTSYFSTKTIGTIFGIRECLEFYQFHLSLISTLKVSKDLLLKKSYSESYDQSLRNGVLIFEVVIEEDSKSIESYIKIFSLLNELALVVDKIYNHQDQVVSKNVEERDYESSVDIILLDSGSNSNIGLKTGVETAKSLFQIFKEIWDFVISHKQYRSSERNGILLESLTVRQEILNKLEAGVITEDEAKKYTHIVKTRAEDLIGMRVMPKEIMEEDHKFSNSKLLKEFKELRLLNGQKL